MCEAHQREYWREKAAESKARKVKDNGRGHGPAPTQSAKAAPPPPAPPRQQGGEKKAQAVNGHPWRQYPQAKPGASKMAKACPVCGRTPAMAGLWARMGVICMGCRVTPAGVIA